MELFEPIVEINVLNTCRTCLKKSNQLYSLLEYCNIEKVTLGEILAALAKIKIANSDQIPIQICYNCKSDIINCYKIISKIQQNEKRLREYVNNTQNITKSDAFAESFPEVALKNDFDEILLNVKVEPDLDLSEDFLSKPNLNENNPIEIVEDSSSKDESRKQYVSYIDKEEDDDFDQVDNVENDEDYVPDDGRSFKKHEQQCSLDSEKYHCEFCDLKFTNKKKIRKHLNQDHVEKPVRTCKKCYLVLVSANDLKNHMEITHSNDSDLVCKECQKKFDNKIKLKTHLDSHLKGNSDTSKKYKKSAQTKSDSSDFDEYLCKRNGLKKVQCKLCNSIFSKVCNLRSHLASHSSETCFNNLDLQNENVSKILNPNNLPLSDLSLLISDKLKQGNFNGFYSIVNDIGYELQINDSETESESGESVMTRNQYSCGVCNQIFDRRYKIFHHQKFEHKSSDLLHSCDKCKMKLSSVKLLNEHIKTICGNKEKNYECPECPMKFTWKDNMEEHCRLIHTQKIIKLNPSGLICDICGKKFARPEHVRRHIKTHLPDYKKYECPTCGKKFNRRDNMRSHMKIHSADRTKPESKKFLCAFCGGSFTNSSNLVVHMRRHTGEKPYECEFCGKGFPRSSDLQCHRRTHTGEKPHLCTICGKGFSRSNKLARHMRIHTGVRPYKCTYCERAFTQSNDLTLHIRRHTGDKPYVCGICGERFIQGTALQHHRQMRGHYEDQPGPYSNISAHNPNSLTSSNRVDQIGVLKPTGISLDPPKIKPVGKSLSKSKPKTILSTPVTLHEPSTSGSTQIMLDQYRNIQNLVANTAAISSTSSVSAGSTFIPDYGYIGEPQGPLNLHSLSYGQQFQNN